MQTFFGFAIADSMFPPECTISRMPLTLEEVRVKLVGAKMCLNPSHKPTVAAAAERFALEITVPEKPAHASLLRGDSVIVMSVRGLPRLEGRHEYTAEEIANASFVFGEWTVR